MYYQFMATLKNNLSEDTVKSENRKIDCENETFCQFYLLHSIVSFTCRIQGDFRTGRLSA